MEQVTWSCEVRGKPIDDGKGAVAGNQQTARQRLREKREWEETGGTGGTAARLLASLPRLEPWKATHTDCDPEGSSYPILISELRTHWELIRWTSHLSEKRWIEGTNWPGLMMKKHRQAAEEEAVR